MKWSSLVVCKKACTAMRFRTFSPKIVSQDAQEIGENVNFIKHFQNFLSTFYCDFLKIHKSYTTYFPFFRWIHLQPVPSRISLRMRRIPANQNPFIIPPPAKRNIKFFILRAFLINDKYLRSLVAVIRLNYSAPLDVERA